MPQLFAGSKTTMINYNLDTPIQLDPNYPHYMNILNFKYNNVFANTTTDFNIFKVTYYFSDGTPAKERSYTLPKHRCMTLNEIYKECTERTKLDDVQYFDIILDTTVGKGVIKPKPDLQQLLDDRKIRVISIDAAGPNSLLKSQFLPINDIVRYESGREFLDFFTDVEPKVSSFDNLFVTCSIIDNNSRTIVNNRMLSVPLLCSVTASGLPFETITYNAMFAIRCHVRCNEIQDIQFVIKNEFNEEPELVEDENGNKADVGFSVSVFIE